MPKTGPTTDQSHAAERIAVLGAGQMGLVCADAAAAANPGADIRVWDRDAEAIRQLRKHRTTTRLPGFRLPETVRAHTELRAALDGATIAVSAVPAQATRSLWAHALASGAITPGTDGNQTAILSVAKGIEIGSGRTPTAAAAAAFEAAKATSPPLAALSGPTIAGELAKQMPATALAASNDHALALRVQRAMAAPWLRVYTTGDILGVEIAGAAKNVVAIAAGVLDGLGLGDNAKSALLARGLAEIVRVGAALGAEQETFFGIAGVGDLATTCFSPLGRNRSCGEAIARGATLETHTAETGHTVEGAPTAKALLALAKEHALDLPITRAVHAVLFETLQPTQAVQELMLRPLKEERIG